MRVEHSTAIQLQNIDNHQQSSSSSQIMSNVHATNVDIVPGDSVNRDAGPLCAYRTGVGGGTLGFVLGVVGMAAGMIKVASTPAWVLLPIGTIATGAVIEKLVHYVCKSGENIEQIQTQTTMSVTDSIATTF